ncbi:MAG TPA: glycosyltransferase family 87 protein [Terracidiphilus sp.]|nr:glycosyltransferase family 87 protein [Terracidiphilus sp.]
MTSNPPAQPGRALASPANLKQLNLICWSVFLVAFVLPFTVIVIASHRPPDGDFAGFYSLGRILNTHPMQDLYDYELQKQVCNEVHARAGAYGLLPYPPFVGMFFQPFARLPYPVAYVLWLLITFALYAAGLKLLIDRFLPLDPVRRSLLYCFAFAYSPFIIDTAASGQLAAVGFFALSVALCQDDADHRFGSGLVLSLCLYKPTLLVLLLPMLLVTRRFRSLLGFAAGAAALAALPTAIGGLGIWAVFFRTLHSFGKVAGGAQASTVLILVKYVDLSSFSAFVHGGRSWAGLAILFLGSAASAVFLLRYWWRSSRCGKPFNALLWAATITWTLLLNVYVPMYDSILIVLALVVTAGALQQIPGPSMQRAFRALWILIVAGSWFSGALDGVTTVQLLTVLFGALGILEFAVLSRIAPLQPDSAHPVP